MYKHRVEGKRWEGKGIENGRGKGRPGLRHTLIGVIDIGKLEATE